MNDEIICECFCITEAEIQQTICANELETVEDVTDACNAGGGCGSCQFVIQDILDEFSRERLRKSLED